MNWPHWPEAVMVRGREINASHQSLNYFQRASTVQSISLSWASVPWEPLGRGLIRAPQRPLCQSPGRRPLIGSIKDWLHPIHAAPSLEDTNACTAAQWGLVISANAAVRDTAEAAKSLGWFQRRHVRSIVTSNPNLTKSVLRYFCYFKIKVTQSKANTFSYLYLCR